MYKSIKLLFMLIVFLFLFGNTVLPVHAESVNIKISLEEGINGKVKRGKGFPVSIKLENSGEAFNGDLLIQYSPSYNTGGAMLVHVELPEKGSKTYQLSVPGLTEDYQSYSQNQSTIHLYKGSWMNGSEVSFKGDKTFKPKFIDSSDQVIGVLSENYDRLKELRILPGIQSEMLPLTKEQLPKKALGLEMLDYLVIDEYAVSSLDEQQQLAIKEWIRSGGVLIAGAAPDASSSYGLLYPLLPMKSEAESLGKTEFLQGATKDEISFKELNLYTGAIEEGSAILHKSDNLPATIKKPFGKGTILQTSFSLGDQPLSTWEGYSTWFSAFIKQANQSHANLYMNGQDMYDQLYWEFAETNEFFPASNYSVTQLIIFLLIYLIIIIPILYFVLRKIDKREHSWWIIPSIAILMSAVVFGIGAKDRIAKPQLNQMGVYQVKDGLLTGIQATTLLSNTSGNYKLSVPKDQFNAVPYTNNYSGFDQSIGAVVEEQRKVNEITFSHVGYWSSKTIYGEAQKETEDQFTVQLTLHNNQLKGSIQNGYPYDFEDIFIWSGNEKIEIGAMKQGETLQIDHKIKQTLLTSPSMFFNTNMYQQTDLVKMKKERLYEAANRFLSGGYNNQPLIAGVTKDPVIDVNMVGKKEKQNNLNLILSPFTVENDFSGNFTIDTGMLSTRVEVVQGLIHDSGMGSPYEIFLDDGEYNYIIQLPEQLRGKKVEFDLVNLRMNGNFLKYSILNRETGEYLPIDEKRTTFALTKENHVEQFFSKDGELLIKFHKSSNGDPYVSLPQVTVKGVVAP
ncbi:hypothetical protein [Fredinandcohnia quinoae]|uniref:Uncharacterized protein n=1 Tax=Fredinandcohnia quinoae TaxID=2918902 RepID=A0AAW5DY22_9BACI|nr:hypothetical protein [Fredinandcohnia sp. SECRCQ15]MCH1625560.1 hypothetical protein [Fredinandcohnia sp. SECRCQ15]